jgi:hypothetical protein
MPLSIRTLVPVVLLAMAACSDSESATSPTTDVDPLLRLAKAQFMQIDRMGIPAVATVFIPSSKKDAYNTAEPANDRAVYSGDVVSVLTAFGHPNPRALAGALLPDIIPFDTRSDDGFLNGRKLADDVITAELGLIFGANAALNDDHVDRNDKLFLTRFPYLAEPHR